VPETVHENLLTIPLQVELQLIPKNKLTYWAVNSYDHKLCPHYKWSKLFKNFTRKLLFAKSHYSVKNN
jgi:hypothetical protein